MGEKEIERLRQNIIEALNEMDEKELLAIFNFILSKDRQEGVQ